MHALSQGFTKLSEKFVKRHWHQGTEALTEVLNDYTSSLTNVIFHHGGDIINCQGDALLVAWLEGHNDAGSREKTVNTAVACGLQLVEQGNDYHTEFGKLFGR